VDLEREFFYSYSYRNLSYPLRSASKKRRSVVGTGSILEWVAENFHLPQKEQKKEPVDFIKSFVRGVQFFLYILEFPPIIVIVGATTHF
jgi:hypothetical protein